MKNLIYIFFLFFPIVATAQGDDNAIIQDKRNCSTMEVFERLKLEDPGYEQRLDAIENQIQQYIKNHPRTDAAIVTIPVVVHVVCKTSAQNISTTQVLSQ